MKKATESRLGIHFLSAPNWCSKSENILSNHKDDIYTLINKNNSITCFVCVSVAVLVLLAMRKNELSVN